MKRYFSVVIRFLMAIYVAWMVYNVGYGVYSLVVTYNSDALKNDAFAHYFKTVEYLFVGSRISIVLFLGSAIFSCLFLFRKKRKCKNMIVAGVLGFVGYFVPFVTYSVYYNCLHIPGYSILIPMCVMCVGLRRYRIEKLEKDEQK